jgi:hypothetical protein
MAKGLRRLQRILNQPDSVFRIFYFDYQLVVPLVMQVNRDGFVGIVNIPEDSLTVLIKRSRRDDSWDTGSGQSNAVIPATCDFRVCPDSSNVSERYFEAALESPEFVRAPDVQRQFSSRYR